MSFDQAIGRWDTARVVTMESLYVADRPNCEGIDRAAPVLRSTIIGACVPPLTHRGVIGVGCAALRPCAPCKSCARRIAQACLGPASANRALAPCPPSVSISNPRRFPTPTPAWHAVTERRFKDAVSFNQAIGRWDTARVVDMGWMYVAVAACCCCCGTFSWSSCGAQLASPLLVTLTHPTPRPTRCRFGDAESFNMNVGLWDVSRVKAMDYMYVAVFHCLATD